MSVIEALVAAMPGKVKCMLQKAGYPRLGKCIRWDTSENSPSVPSKPQTEGKAMKHA